MANEARKRIRKLLRKTERSASRIMAAQDAAREHIVAEILNPRYTRGGGASRTALYREIVSTYGKAARVMDGEMYGICREAAEAASNRNAAKTLYEIISPANGENPAAAWARNRSEATISALRNEFIETAREAAQKGMAKRYIQGLLRRRWNEAAMDEQNFQFVDRAGRHWNQDAYARMLTRTTAQRAYNEAVLDRLAADGQRYVRITSPGVPDCAICKQWNNLVVRITKDGEGAVPTVADATDAGVFHPNCMCFLEAAE